MATCVLCSADAVKSVTVIPDVKVPRVSTSTSAGRYVNTAGSAMLAIAHTSCTGGSPVLSSASRYCASAGSSNCSPSAPRPRIRSWTAAVACARSVTSSPIIRTVHPARKTIAAASGSAQMLNSAAWFMLPRLAEPPMITKSLTQVASRGSRLSASPMLVSGPVATSVISPRAAPMASMM
jgi:hypothetical protein